MFPEVELSREVTICAKNLKGKSPHQQILRRLLEDLLREKACKEHGFYLGITAIKSISKNNINDIHGVDVLRIPVSFTCRTFLPLRGEILQGVVARVYWSGVIIRSGPLRYAYLSTLKMPKYQYVSTEPEGEKAYFQKDDLSKIAVGVVVRFAVMDVRFEEIPNNRRNDIYVLATMEGDDALGPISLTGPDEPYM